MSNKYVKGGWLQPWGTRIAKIINKSSLGDISFLPDLEVTPEPKLKIYVQPGNGGPVEDWINLSNIESVSSGRCLVVNGALDKVRGGYYPKQFFPALGSVTDSYYNKGEDWEGGEAVGLRERHRAW